jgi:hypothetical protein
MVAVARPRRRRRKESRSPIPRKLRKKVAEFARDLSRQYASRFTADRDLRTRVGRLVKNLLPPKPRRRGRPGIQAVTDAIRLRRRFRRQYPRETAKEIWNRVYPLAIRGYNRMIAVDQESARYDLRERVSDRLRKRARRKRPRKIPAEMSLS